MIHAAAAGDAGVVEAGWNPGAAHLSGFPRIERAERVTAERQGLDRVLFHRIRSPFVGVFIVVRRRSSRSTRCPACSTTSPAWCRWCLIAVPDAGAHLIGVRWIVVERLGMALAKAPRQMQAYHGSANLAAGAGVHGQVAMSSSEDRKADRYPVAAHHGQAAGLGHRGDEPLRKEGCRDQGPVKVPRAARRAADWPLSAGCAAPIRR